MSKSPINVPDFRPGMRKLPADDLNAILSACQRPGISSEGIAGADVTWIGIIDATGKTDYTDERYWVKLAYCDNSSGDEDARITFDADDDDARFPQVTATNLGELAAGTHTLAEGDIVRVHTVRDPQSPSVRHYYFRGGLPGGGLTGEVLQKASDADGDYLTGPVLVLPNPA